MYQEHFGLRCMPFDDRADIRFNFATPEQEETLAAFEYEVHYGKGMTALVGESGVGKTLLIRTLVSKLHATDHVVVVTQPSNGQAEILRAVCKGFGITLPNHYSSVRALARLRRRFVNTAKASHRSILLVDQAENLCAENLTQIATLAELNSDQDNLISIALVGQPQFKTVIEAPKFDRLRQELFREQHLSPLVADQTGDYIEHRLRIAGIGDTKLFTDEAIAAVHEASDGIPRLINRIADAAMLAAYGAEQGTITEELVREVTTRVVDQKTANVRDVRLIATGHSNGTKDKAVAPQSRRSEFASAGAIGSSVEANVRSQLESGSESLNDENHNTEYPTQDDPTHKTIGKLVSRIEELEHQLAIGDGRSGSTSVLPNAVQSSEQKGQDLIRQMEALIESLHQSVEHAGNTVESIESRMAQTIADSENRFVAMESRAASASDSARITADKVERISRACEEADRVEAKLVTFTEDLADKADQVQEQMGHLVAGLDGAKDIQRDLSVASANASSQKHDLESAIKAGEQRIEQSASATEKLMSDLAATAIKQLHEELLQKTRVQECEQNASLIAMEESARDRLQKIGSEFQANIASIRGESLNQADQMAQEHANRISKELDAEVSRLSSTAHEATDRIQELLGQAKSTQSAVESARDDVERRLNDQNETVQKRQKDFERQLLQESKRIVAEQMNSYTEALEIDLAKGIEDVRTLKNETTSLVEKARHATADAITDERCELDTLKKEMIAGRNQLESTAAHSRKTVQEAVEHVSQQSELLTQTLDKAKTQCNTLKPEVETLDISLGNTSSRIQKLKEDVNYSARTVGELEPRCEKLQDTLNSTDRQAEETIAKAQASVGQLEAVQRGTATTILEIGKASQQLTDTQQRMQLCEQLCARLATLQEQSEETVGSLTKVVRDAKQSHETLHRGTAIADDKVSKLGSHLASGQNVLRDLTNANASAQKSVEQMKQTFENASATQEQIEVLVKDVWSLTAKTEVNANKLESASAKADEVIANVNLCTGSADDFAKGLNDRIDTAKKEIGGMAEKCEQGRKVAEKLGTITQVLAAAKKTGDDIEKTLEEARKVQEFVTNSASETDIRCAHLENVNATAQGMIETQQQLKHEVDMAAVQLESHIAAVNGTVTSQEDLQRELVEQAKGLASRLEAMAGQTATIEQKVGDLITKPKEMIAEAREQAEQLERVCQAVRKVFAGLSKASLEARQHTENIDKKTSSSTTQIAELSRVSASKIAEMTAESERAVALLHESMDEKTAASNAQIAEMTAASTSELAELSKTSVSQIAEMTAESERAVATLHEWVQEAVHAQSRLERTLQQTPAIQQTHPTLTQSPPTSASDFIRVANKKTFEKTATQSGTIPKTMPRKKVEASPSARAERPESRGDEIAKIINETKRKKAKA